MLIVSCTIAQPYMYKYKIPNFLFVSGYNNFVPLASNDETLNLEIDIMLYKMLDMDLDESTFTMLFKQVIKWSDKRLR